MKKADNVFHYLLLLGGNIGDVPHTMAMAVEHLGMLGRVDLVSSLFCSEAWGFESDNIFYNQVVELSSSLTPFDLLRQTQDIERLLGRLEKSHDGVYQSRLIDIDILFCHDVSLHDGSMADVIISSPRLTLPHKLLHRRRFTLMPLAEKWPSLMHPLLHMSISQLLDNCDDKGRVWPMIINA